MISISLLLLISYTAQSTVLPKNLYIVENQGCGSPMILFHIYEGDDYSKYVGKIEIVKSNGETIRQFVTPDGIVAKTETDIARTNVAIIRNSKNEIANRILSGYSHTPTGVGVLRFSLISAEAKETASIRNSVSSNSIEIEARISKDLLLNAVQDETGIWKVQIRESAETDDLSLIMLLAWYRSQYYEACALRSFFQAAVNNAPYVLGSLALALGCYFGGLYNPEQAASVI